MDLAPYLVIKIPRIFAQSKILGRGRKDSEKNFFRGRVSEQGILFLTDIQYKYICLCKKEYLCTNEFLCVRIKSVRDRRSIVMANKSVLIIYRTGGRTWDCCRKS